MKYYRDYEKEIWRVDVDNEISQTYSSTVGWIESGYEVANFAYTVRYWNLVEVSKDELFLDMI